MKISTSVFPWRFIILAYSIAWVCWIPVAVTRQDYQSSPLLLSLLSTSYVSLIVQVRLASVS